MPPDERVNILLVDDYPENLVALEWMLADLRQNLVKAASGREALRALLDQEFALILLDVQMPDLDGFETARLIRSREKTAHTPIVFLTAINKSDTHVARGYSLGAVDYLFKPLVPEILKAKVAAFVELAKKTRQLRREIAQRRQAEAELDRSNTQLAAISQALVEFISEGSPAATFATLLARILVLTRSEYGFAGEIRRTPAGEPYLRRYGAVSAVAHDPRGPAARPPAAEEADLHNLRPLCKALEESGQPLIANNPGSAPRRQLLPPGHPPVSAFLGVPLYRGEALVGMVGLANRPGGYSEALVNDLRPFLHTCAILIDACRIDRQRREAEEQVRQLNEDLERRVAERTEALEAANREIQEAGRRKDEFLAMLAHELRNPLAAISSAEYVLDEIGWPDPRVSRLRTIIHRQTQHLARLVDDLLDIGRITRGKIELRREPVTLAVVVERAVDATLPFIEAREHTLSVALPDEPVWLEADATRLEQVLANLLNNAAKYTDPGGRIWLTAKTECGSVGVWECGGPEVRPLPHSRTVPEVVIRIRDTGIGMPPNLLPHVFELFTQAEPSLDRTQGGMGIGLALVHELVQLHGGSVTGTSEGLGRGSEFVVRLPVLPPDRAPTEWRNGEPPPAERRKLPAGPLARVLIVEDNADAAETLAEILALWGHEVRVAHTGAAALEEAPVYQPRAVLLDIGLPGMDGYEVARRLREHPSLNGTLLVALTGYGQPADRRRSEAAGIDRHLTKPVDPVELQELLVGVAACDRKRERSGQSR